jgi:hypothetical protein
MDHKEWLKNIGRKGGRSKSAAKMDAVRRNLERARAKKRVKAVKPIPTSPQVADSKPNKVLDLQSGFE